jgi:uncharacterized membrane protein YesL
VLRAPGAIWAGFSAYYSRPGFLAVVNVQAFLYSLPLVVLAVVPFVVAGRLVLIPLALAVLVGVMPNPAAAGLQYCAKLVARDDQVDITDVRRGFREYWRPATALYVFDLLALVLIIANVVFYSAQGGGIFLALSLIWLYLLVTWTAVQVYLYPMLLSMEHPSVPLVFRNALVLVVRRPISTFFVTVTWLAVLLIASASPLVVIAGLIVPAIMQQSLLDRLLPGLAPSVRAATPSEEDSVRVTKQPLAKRPSSRTRRRLKR